MSTGTEKWLYLKFRFCHRKYNPVKDIKLIGAIHSGSFNNLIRDGLNMLLHHKYSKSTEHSRNNKCLIAVHPSEFLNHRVFRNNCYTPWNHHSSQYKAKRIFLPLNLYLLNTKPQIVLVYTTSRVTTIVINKLFPKNLMKLKCEFMLM